MSVFPSPGESAIKPPPHVREVIICQYTAKAWYWNSGCFSPATYTRSSIPVSLGSIWNTRQQSIHLVISVWSSPYQSVNCPSFGAFESSLSLITLYQHPFLSPTHITRHLHFRHILTFVLHLAILTIQIYIRPPFSILL